MRNGKWAAYPCFVICSILENSGSAVHPVWKSTGARKSLKLAFLNAAPPVLFRSRRGVFFGSRGSAVVEGGKEE